MNQQTLSTDISNADAVGDLLQHIGWQEVILPKLTKLKEDLSRQLVQVTLGETAITPSGTPLNAEQIAGRIAGITYIEGLMASILRKGHTALDIIARSNEL